MGQLQGSRCQGSRRLTARGRRPRYAGLATRHAGLETQSIVGSSCTSAGGRQLGAFWPTTQGGSCHLGVPMRPPARIPLGPTVVPQIRQSLERLRRGQGVVRAIVRTRAANHGFGTREAPRRTNHLGANVKDAAPRFWRRALEEVHAKGRGGGNNTGLGGPGGRKDGGECSQAGWRAPQKSHFSQYRPKKRTS